MSSESAQRDTPNGKSISIDEDESQRVQEKENEFLVAGNKKLEGKANDDNILNLTDHRSAVGVPSPSALKERNQRDFGALSSIYVNVNRNVINGRPRSKLPSSSSQEVVVSNSQHVKEFTTRNTSSSTKPETFNECMNDDTALSIDESKSSRLIGQSKKIMGFLGGSIITALSNQVPSMKTSNLNENGDNPVVSLEQINIEEDAIENDEEATHTSFSLTQNSNLNHKRGNDSTITNDDNEIEIVNHPSTPLLEPKQKYWETLLYPSEDSNQLLDRNLEEPQSLSTLEKSQGMLPLLSPHETKPNVVDDIFEDCGSPENLASVPIDCSLKGSAFNDSKPPTSKGIISQATRSQESVLCNIISTATDPETPMVKKSLLGPLEDPSSSNNEERHSKFKASPQSMISIPNDYSPGEKDAQKIQGSHPVTRKVKSPALSMHDNTLNETNIQTPVTHGMNLILASGNNITNSSPEKSDFCNMLSSATASQTPLLDVAVVRQEYLECTSEAEQSSLKSDDRTVLEETPVKCNRTQVFRSTYNSSLLSHCDESEDGSIFSSIQSSIKSNSPRNRRIMEWIGPEEPNSVSWPTPSMTCNIQASETPERHLHRNKSWKKSTKGINEIAVWKQKHDSGKASIFWAPCVHERSSSPTSLPSILGTASVNEVSDLESPNIIMPALNFKFSDEESTIHSQSIHEACDINSTTDHHEIKRAPSPQSLMTVDTESVGHVGEDTVREATEHFREKQSIEVPKSIINPKSSDDESFAKNKKRNISAHSSIMGTQPEPGYGKGSNTSRWLMRCVVLGMIIAAVGVVTVLVMTFTSKANESKLTKDTEPDQESINDTTMPTKPLIPSDFSFKKTVAPTVIGTHTLSSYSSESSQPRFDPFSPTSHPASEAIIGIETSTIHPIPPEIPSPSQVLGAMVTSKPSSYISSRPEPSVQGTSQPSMQPTMNPNSIPTFSKERLEKLIWDRTIRGEDMWRQGELGDSQAPTWFFAAEKSSGMRIEIIDATKGDRISSNLRNSMEDYKQSNAISSVIINKVPYEFLCPPPEAGQIKVCSGDFGNTDWIGSTIFFMREDYIVSALIRVNESSSSHKGDAILQYSICHQLGHALGLGHRESDSLSPSCMIDLGGNDVIDGNTIRMNKTLQHPNFDDLDILENIYEQNGIRRLRGNSILR